MELLGGRQEPLTMVAKNCRGWEGCLGAGTHPWQYSCLLLAQCKCCCPWL